jgi:hypothetical protein
MSAYLRPPAAGDPCNKVTYRHRQLRGRWSAGSDRLGGIRCENLCHLTNAADFRPDLECPRPGSSVLGGSDVIAAETEEVIDLIVG